MNSNNYSCTIHGSYRKDLETIRQVAELMSFIGVRVLCPTSFKIESNIDGFVKFIGDIGTSEEIESNLIEVLRKNSANPNFFAYFVNVNGYIGPSASYELSLISETGAKYFVLNQPENVPIKLDSNKVLRPIEVARKVLFNTL